MKRFSLMGITLAILGCWGAGRPAHAATIAVTTTTDEFGTGPDCSLREALEAANSNKAFGGCSAGEAVPTVDTVSVGPGTYSLSIKSGEENQSGDLNTTESVTVVGDPANPAGTVIDASAIGDAVFEIRAEDGGSVTLRGITIKGGKGSFGGGIQVDTAQLVVEYSIIRDNSATHAGGGIYAAYDATMVVIRNSLIMSNHADHGDNDDGDGGGLFFNNGAAKIINTTFDYNTATHKGGGIWNTHGSLTLVNVTITQNSAHLAGGGVYAPFNTTAVRNSIIAYNHSSAALDTQNCVFEDQQTANPSLGYNVENANTCKFTATGDVANSGNLQMNPYVGYSGGATPVHSLGAGSDAVDRVAAGACTDLEGAALTVDQRGSSRPVDADGSGGALCDSGASEREACGDGVRGAGEACDPGLPSAVDCCSDDCRSYQSSGNECQNGAASLGYCDAAGYCNTCGDGVIGPNEDCDTGPDLALDCCDANCRFAPATSSCDDGNVDTTGDACDGAGICAGALSGPPVPAATPQASEPPSVPPDASEPPAIPPGTPPLSSGQQTGEDAQGVGVANGPTAGELRGSGCALQAQVPVNGTVFGGFAFVLALLAGMKRPRNP